MKSAAEFKPKAMSGAQKKEMQKQLDDMPTLEETWENAYQAFVNTAEVSVQLAGRIDNLMNIRDMVYKFHGEEQMEKLSSYDRMAYLKKKLDLSIETYKAIQNIVYSFEMDEFLKEDMKDYFEEIMPSVDSLANEEDMLEAAIVFLTVKPWGEKMTALHHTMLDEKKQREYLEQ